MNVAFAECSCTTCPSWSVHKTCSKTKCNYNVQFQNRALVDVVKLTSTQRDRLKKVIGVTVTDRGENKLFHWISGDWGLQSNEGICFALAWPVFDNWEWVVAPVQLFSKGSLLVFQLLWQPSPNLSLLFKVCGTIIKFDYWYLGKWLIFWKSWRPLRVWGLICEPVHIKLKFELLGWTWRGKI